MDQLIDCKMNFFQYEDEKPYQAVLIYVSCKKISGELSMEYLDQWEKDHGGGMPEWVPLDSLADAIFIHSVDSRPMIRKAEKML